jgi:hypothetical protein
MASGRYGRATGLDVVTVGGFGVTTVEEIPEHEVGPWGKVGTSPTSKKLPAFNFLAWLAVVLVAACLQLLRSASDRARAAGMPWGGTAMDALAVFGAVGLAVAAVAVVLRRRP